jgi:metal-dependent amidase/aminoacylase/carboxypeptidase family protein
MPCRYFLAPLLALFAAAWIMPARSQSIVPELEQEIRLRAAQIETKLIAWRRDIHEHPELGQQETRTAGIVAAHLTALGLEVKTGVAQTGVVALLKGGKPGPVVALRADMDARCRSRSRKAFRSPRTPGANISVATWMSCMRAATTRTRRF